MPALIYYQRNDNVIILDDLKNYVANTYVNDATVTVTLYDDSGDVISGAENLVMSYVAASDGEYRATLPYTLTCTCHRVYTAKITADGGSGLRGFWEVPVLIEERTQT